MLARTKLPHLGVLVVGCTLLASSACTMETRTPSQDTIAAESDPILANLARTGKWERTAHPVRTSNEPMADGEAKLPSSEAALAAKQDQAWRAADGERYEELFVLPSGVAYGRRGAAIGAPIPDATNGYGASGPVTGGGVSPKIRIGTDSSGDRRTRVSSVTTLTSFPTATNGAMSGDGNTQTSGCSGTMVGPRAVLTAAHCVMNFLGTISFNGKWNPGQTNASAPFGTASWSGVHLRDWRLTDDRQFDYAVIYLPDSQTFANIGWMGIVWFNNQAGYTGRTSSIRGYPCGPLNSGCGAPTVQTCKASPRADKACDGWMYADDQPLNSTSFTSVNSLQFDNDVSKGESGSAVFTIFNGAPAVMAIVTHQSACASCTPGGGNLEFGPRFRQSMFDDVCSWIGDPNFQSSFRTHSLCHP